MVRWEGLCISWHYGRCTLDLLNPNASALQISGVTIPSTVPWQFQSSISCDGGGWGQCFPGFLSVGFWVSPQNANMFIGLSGCFLFLDSPSPLPHTAPHGITAYQLIVWFSSHHTHHPPWYIISVLSASQCLHPPTHLRPNWYFKTILLKVETNCNCYQMFLVLKLIVKIWPRVCPAPSRVPGGGNSPRNLQESAHLKDHSFWPQREKKILPSTVQSLCPFWPWDTPLLLDSSGPHAGGLNTRAQIDNQKDSKIQHKWMYLRNKNTTDLRLPGGGKDWESGIINADIHIGWINNKVLLYSTGDYSVSCNKP